MKLPVELGKDSYDIILERGAIKRAGEIFPLDRKVLLVTDDKVPEKYSGIIESQCGEAIKVIIPHGESSKNLSCFELLCRKMVENNFGRGDCALAVGGGVVGDLTGFAASCYMRGIDFYNVPTTLLSQVDSSVGGKTAIDFCGIKNILGTFNQPRGVAIDPDVLATLDKRQLACGMAEIIKMAMLFDKELFDYIEQKKESVLPAVYAGGDADHGLSRDVDGIIRRALDIKIKVVEKDEKEAGLRRTLNFGHTLGHGIEACTGLLHGEAVALGMIPMCSGEVRDRLVGLLPAFGLPVGCSAQPQQVLRAVAHDKKAMGGETVMTVRCDEIGTYKFEKTDMETLLKEYREAFQ